MGPFLRHVLKTKPLWIAAGAAKIKREVGFNDLSCLRRNEGRHLRAFIKKCDPFPLQHTVKFSYENNVAIYERQSSKYLRRNRKVVSDPSIHG